MTKRTTWAYLFAAYFLLHVAIRVACGGSLGLDEAQILRHAQNLEWGYGPQPPLYAWLQFLVLKLTGNTIFGLAMLKNMMLFAMVMTVFFMLSREVPVERAGLATAALVLMPQIGWESQRALTHSVIAVMFVTATYFGIWTMLRSGRNKILHYVCLGALMGLGLLAKPNYAIAPIAALLAACTIPSMRERLSWKGGLVSLVIVAALIAKPVMWMMQNADRTLSAIHKFGVSVQGSLLSIAAQGAGAWAHAVLSFAILPLSILGVLFLGFRERKPNAASELQVWLRLSMLIGGALMLALVLVSQTTKVKDRWFIPVLPMMGPFVALWLFDHASKRGVIWLSRVIVALVCIFVIGQPVHNLIGPGYRTAPYDVLVQEITQKLQAGEQIITNDWIAGNLIYRNPSLPIPPATQPLAARGQYVVLWSKETQAKFQRTLDQTYGDGTWTISVPEALTAPYRFDVDSRFTLQMARLEYHRP